MLEYLKRYRKQINAIIYILGFFALVNWIIGLYLMITYKAPLQDFNIDNNFSINHIFNNFGIFIVIFIIIVCLILPFVLIKKEFRRQELLETIKNEK